MLKCKSAMIDAIILSYHYCLYRFRGRPDSAYAQRPVPVRLHRRQREDLCARAPQNDGEFMYVVLLYYSDRLISSVYWQQTLPLRPMFTEKLQAVWADNHVMKRIPQNVTVITESMSRTKGTARLYRHLFCIATSLRHRTFNHLYLTFIGSCCDNGRNIYAKCGENW